MAMHRRLRAPARVRSALDRKLEQSRQLGPGVITRRAAVVTGILLLLAAVYFVFWLFGGLWYSKIGNVEVYYWLGWATLLAYLPFYWYRVYVEDKR